MSKKIIVIVGAGPGLGIHIAKEFAMHDFKPILIARRKQKLMQIIEELHRQEIEAEGIVADAFFPETLTTAFSYIQQQYGAIDVMVYNAAVQEQDTIAELEQNIFLKNYQVNIASAVHCVRLLMPEMEKRSSGSILFTGGGLAIQPKSTHISLSVGKAALRALGAALYESAKEKGIYVGMVTITGRIQSDTKYDSARIASEFWKLYKQQCEYERII